MTIFRWGMAGFALGSCLTIYAANPIGGGIQDQTSLSVGAKASQQAITLDEAIRVAFESSPSIKSALSQIESARGAMDEASAHFRPTFNVGTTTTFQGPVSTMNVGASSIALQQSPATSATLSATLPLDLTRQIRYSSEIARRQFQVQYLAMLSTSEQLIADVKGAYYDVLRAGGQEQVAQSAVDAAKARLGVIQAKREAGTAPQYDVTSAEVELDNLTQSLIVAQNTTSLAQSSLNRVMGIDVNTPTQVVVVDVPITTETVDIRGSIDTALANRPEVKSANASVAISETNVRLQKAGAMPSLSLTGGPSYNFNPGMTSTSNSSWSIAFGVSFPAYDGGVTKAKVRQAKAAVQTSRSALEDRKLTVAQEVRSAALNLQEAARRSKTTAHAVKLAEDALDIATERYKAGIAVLVEVTNSQSQLTQARVNDVNARYDYAVALAKLQRATSSQPELDHLRLLADPAAAKTGKQEPRS